MLTQAFRFDEATHSYWVGERKLTSVTTVLKKFGFYPHIQFATDEHLWRGQAIHEMMELHHKKTLDVEKLDPLIVGYRKAWLKFEGMTGFHTLGFEKRIYHPVLLYGGTPDLWGKVEREIWVMDYKHGVVQRVTGLQLAAYVEAMIACGLLERNGMRIRRVGIQLKADGDYKLTFFDDPLDFEIWKMMISVFNVGKNWGLYDSNN